MRGGWAVLTLATRQATDGVSAAWTSARIPADPAAMSVGVDTETGEEVLVAFDERMLISGASGSGKSWAARPLMATAHLRGDLVFVDGKGEEATLWDGICRVAVTPAEIDLTIDEVHAEMTRRAIELKRRRLSRWDGPQLTVLIDEGQVVLAQVRRDKGRLQRLVELSSLGRSRGVVLWWATQYPVTDGSAPGVDKMIAPNLLTRFSLRVASSVQAQVALDDCADYAPQQIPDGRQYRGHGYLKDYGPRLIRTWTLDDTAVRALPVSVWHATPPEPDPDRGERHLTLVTDPAAQPGPLANRDRVLRAVRDGARSNQEIGVATGLHKGTVSRTVTALLTTGEVFRTPDGTLTTSAGEVSA
ncbi:type IV secretory system conjugative DNA transfer family protein [Candidatus Frankia alpina]|uniref:type IV secretory system conjugative DNA transfer family protein n=1 Tax=Candidatus Frankia alpina TaxID=2699483 RepID=UPI001A99161E|nr:type IV secretory system conjugative DNA transfer family protein [Candidatus Frankia alpina]